MSLRLRVALATLLTTAVVVTLVGVALVALVGADEREDLDDQLAQQAVVVGQRSALIDPDRRAVEEVPVERVIPNLNVVGRLRQDDESILRLGDFPLADEVPAPLGYSTTTADGVEWRIYAVPVRDVAPRVARDPATADTVVEVAMPTTELDARLERLRRQATRLGLVGMALAFGVGFVLGKAALRPLARLRRDTEQLTDRDPTAGRVAEDQGLAEVDEVGRSMNQLLDRIAEANRATEAALEASRSFAANAAHELRTPLTSLQANVDVLARNPDLDPAERQAVVDELRGQQERLLRLLESLRLLARGDLAGQLPRDEVDVVELLRELVASARRRHPEADIELDAAPGTGSFRGWREGLRVLFGNVVDNAVLHGHRPGEPARVRVTVPSGEGLDVTVDDAGPGVPADQRAQVLTRFGRGTGAEAAGSGLGLALAEQQARLHGGTLRLDDAPLGGLRVEVHLP